MTGVVEALLGVASVVNVWSGVDAGSRLTAPAASVEKTE